MKKSERDESWVIYRAITQGEAAGPQAVCEQTEWEKMVREHPGMHALVQAGIANEGAAERLARGTSGDARPKAKK